MKCPFCGNGSSKVVETRRNSGEESVRRRRECKECEKRFTTYETVKPPCIKVKKSDGSLEDFKRDKIFEGVSKAFEKRSVDMSRINSMVDGIEASLIDGNPSVVESRRIGEMVMERLKEVDEVAYIRFASVYRDFDDADSFKKELEQLDDDE